MNEETGVRFFLDEKNQAANFVYRPLNGGQPIAQNATVAVKFAQNVRILDEWYLFGGTKWTRTLFRLKHPIVYGKRGLRNLYRRIKRIFVKEPPPVLCRLWKNKEELLHLYPEVNNGNNQEQKNAEQQDQANIGKQS